MTTSWCVEVPGEMLPIVMCRWLGLLSKSLRFLIWAAICGVFNSSASAQEINAVGRRISATLIEQYPGTFVTRVDLDALVNGQTTELRLALINPENNPSIVLGDPIASCGCIKIVVSKRVIEPGESIDAVISIKVTASGTPMMRQTINFDPREEGQSNVKIYLNSRILRTLSFEQRDFLVQVPSAGTSDDLGGKLIEKALPFYFSPPVKFPNIELKVLSEHRAVTATISKVDEEHGVVDVAIHPSLVGEDGLRLGFAIEDESTGLSSSVVGAVIARPPLSVLPRLLRFAPKDEGTYWEANVLLVRNLLPTDQAVSENQPSIEATMAGNRFDIHIDSASATVCRLRAKIKEDVLHELDQRDAVVRWDIVWGKERLSAKSTVAFETVVDGLGK